ncbi:MAG: class I SAM-dependent methyltransferase [Phormidesmis sp.]
MTLNVKPRWAGDDALSRFVNLLIKTKPIYSLMKTQARKVIIKTAEKNGISWKEKVRQLETQQLKTQNAEQALAQVTDASITYPSYYTLPFHAYNEGNLCWLAAYEAVPATYAMPLRIWPNESLTWQAAQTRLRDSFHSVLAEHGPAAVSDILDMGCSVGISTRAVHAYYSQQQNEPVRTLGLDLSPYMLSVAQLENNENIDADRNIQWKHAKAEETNLPDNSFDLVTLQFVIHELPRHITKAIFNEAYRLLRTGGSLAITDNNPKSKVIQNLPPVLFTLMKSTEPWSDDYYTFDVESALAKSGFEGVVTVESDPRHRTIIGKKQ